MICMGILYWFCAVLRVFHPHGASPLPPGDVRHGSPGSAADLPSRPGLRPFRREQRDTPLRASTIAVSAVPGALPAPLHYALLPYLCVPIITTLYMTLFGINSKIMLFLLQIVLFVFNQATTVRHPTGHRIVSYSDYFLYSERRN